MQMRPAAKCMATPSAKADSGLLLWFASTQPSNANVGTGVSRVECSHLHQHVNQDSCRFLPGWALPDGSWEPMAARSVVSSILPGLRAWIAQRRSPALLV